MASRGLNKVTLIGYPGADPEARSTTSGSTVTTIRVATSESWKDKQTGETQERTEWHRVKFFGRLAEIADQYLRKGGQVYIEGSLRTEKYTDKDGIERYSTDIIANEMQMLGARQAGEDRDFDRDDDRDDAPQARGRESQGGARESQGGGGGRGGYDRGSNGGGGGRGGYDRGSNGGGGGRGYDRGGGGGARDQANGPPF